MKRMVIQLSLRERRQYRTLAKEIGLPLATMFKRGLKALDKARADKRCLSSMEQRHKYTKRRKRCVRWH